MAGLVPIRLRRIHILAYLSNVLAPVWDVAIDAAHLLKQPLGPHYPALQRELDRFVGMGLVSIEDIGFAQDELGQWQLDGAFRFNRKMATPALELIESFPEERQLQEFVREIAFAISGLRDIDIDLLPTEDPCFADPTISNGNVVDFSELRKPNFSANAANYFKEVAGATTPGELLHMYARHVGRRLSGRQ